MKHSRLAMLLLIPLFAILPAHAASMSLPAAAEVPETLTLAFTKESGEPLAGTHIHLPFDASTGQFGPLNIPLRIFSNAPSGTFTITIDSFRNPILKSGRNQFELIVEVEGRGNLSSQLTVKPHQDLFPKVSMTPSGAASRVLIMTIRQAKPTPLPIGTYTGKFALTVSHRP